MGLTLPGVLGRIFTAAANLFQTSQINTESFPSYVVMGDGRLRISDGTEDLTSGSLVYTDPTAYIRTRPNKLGLVIRGEDGGSIRNILEIQDFLNAPICWVLNAGGFGINDNIQTVYSPTAGGPAMFADIYGHFQLGGQTAMRCNSGPPGNIMRFDDSTGEIFQRNRGSSQGTWTATNGTYAAAFYGGFSIGPAGLQTVRQWTAVAAGNIVTTTATGTSGYPVGSGIWVAATIVTKSLTVARSKQLAMICYNTAGTSIGTLTGTAVTDNTTGFTRLDVQGVTPAGTVTCALQLTVTAAAINEQHQDTMAGIWSNLTTAQLTAWNPPFVFRQNAFGATSAVGLNDGANIGDVFIRADGPGNVVQRFWTCIKSGHPWEQKWSSDPRLTSQPSRFSWYGGTYLLQGASSNADYVLPMVAGGMMHNDPLDSVNHGVTSARLMDDTAAASAAGGMSQFIQSVRKKNTGQPYVSKDGVFALWYGPWDIGFITAAQGASVMSHMNGYSATPGATGAAFINTLRYVIRHARASVILPYTHAAFAKTGGSASGQVPYAYSGGSAGVGGTFWFFTTVGNSFTFTIPSDFEGGAVSIGLIGAEGAFGGTVTWTGTCPGATGTTSTSNVSDPGFRNRVVRTFSGLTAANAGQTIIGTVSALDAGGGISLDAALIEGPNPNLVFVLGAPRLRDNTAYTTLGATMVASSYWAGNSGTTGDADITTLNTSLSSLCAEFTDSLVQFVDMDGAIQKFANYYYSVDGVRFDESGVHAMAQQFVASLNSAIPAVDFRSINHDYHDTTVAPVGSVFTKQGTLSPGNGVSRFVADDWYYLSNVRATVNTAPVGSSIIVDVFKNGSTVFTTTANRPTITAGTNTALSGTPDILFVAPGDYLTVNIVQAGSTTPGSDLTVAVNGRRIPIP